MGVTPTILFKSTWSMFWAFKPNLRTRSRSWLEMAEIECLQLCAGVQVHVQERLFFVDLHILSLCGADLVLGVQWLKSLGLVPMDYNNLTMKFLCVGWVVELKEDTHSELRFITPPQLRYLVRKDGANGFFCIRIVSQEPPSTQTITSPFDIPVIASLIHKFKDFFQISSSLPPSRTTNHSILGTFGQQFLFEVIQMFLCSKTGRVPGSSCFSSRCETSSCQGSGHSTMTNSPIL